MKENAVPDVTMPLQHNLKVFRDIVLIMLVNVHTQLFVLKMESSTKRVMYGILTFPNLEL